MNTRRSVLLAAVVASLVSVLVVYSLPAVAGVGDALILGSKSNNGGNKTTSATAKVTDGPAFKFTNDAGGNRATVRIDTDGNAPPFATNSDRKVVNFNADYLDGLDPSDIVAAGPRLHTVSSPDVVSTTSTSWVNVPFMRKTVTVPAGENQNALIVFSGVVDCNQNPVSNVWCRVRVQVDGNSVWDGTFSGAQHSGNSTEVYGEGAHSLQTIKTDLGPGDHIVNVQYRVDDSNSTHQLRDTFLSITTFPSSSVSASSVAAASGGPEKG